VVCEQREFAEAASLWLARPSRLKGYGNSADPKEIDSAAQKVTAPTQTVEAQYRERLKSPATA
jgi:hypothetical protein